MARPRKAPARITTFNLPITIADEIDALRLSNRSAWMTGILKDYFARRSEEDQAFAERAAIRADPAALIGQIPTNRLAAALLDRVQSDQFIDPETAAPIPTKRLANSLIKFISTPKTSQREE